MSEVRLVVREADCFWSGTVHGSTADRVVAALSADPVTLKELKVALGRYEKRCLGGSQLGNLRPSSDDEPYDAGLVVIDLAARLVVVDSTYSSPGHKGDVDFHDGNCATEHRLRYALADDWQFLDRWASWKACGDEHRRQQVVPLDARAIFFGRPLIEFLARETFAAFARREEIAAAARSRVIEEARERLARDGNVAPDQITDEAIHQTWHVQRTHENPFHDTIKDIHAAWLLTPRDDLGGKSPREMSFARRDHLTWDLQHQSEHWSKLHVCPPGIAETAHAYRFAGFGTHEMVEYYELVRKLLWSCWERLKQMADSPEGRQQLESFTVGDFLTTEVPRLEEVREQWLDSHDASCHGRTPRSIIARERARIPEAVSGQDAMVDPDCPCCQMIADMPGPMFWHLDGSEMDDEFAFDLHCETREEWDEERRRWAENAKKFNAEWEERKRLGVTSEREDSVWSTSFVIGDSSDVPLGVRVFGVGCKLAEVIAKLRGNARADSAPADAPAVQSLIDQLNRDFGNLRALLIGSEVALAESLLEPVVEKFRETLDEVATFDAMLLEKCNELGESLGQLTAPAPPTPDFDEDFDIPF